MKGHIYEDEDPVEVWAERNGLEVVVHHLRADLAAANERVRELEEHLDLLQGDPMNEPRATNLANLYAIAKERNRLRRENEELREELERVRGNGVRYEKEQIRLVNERAAAVAKLAAVRGMCEACQIYDDDGVPVDRDPVDPSVILATIDGDVRHPAEDKVDELTAKLAAVREVVENFHRMYGKQDLLRFQRKDMELILATLDAVEFVRVVVSHSGGLVSQRIGIIEFPDNTWKDGDYLLVKVPKEKP